jgi:hypothetical protein
MREDTQSNAVAGESVHVGDCYVWAEITYLDSTTDYREFLPSDSSTATHGENWYYRLRSATRVSKKLPKIECR